MEQAVQFLSVLMGGYWPDRDLRLELRCLAPGEAYRIRRQWYPLLPDCLVQAARHALGLARQFDVYCGVLPRSGCVGKTEGIHYTDFFWCDIDGGDKGPHGAAELLKASGLPAPHLIVLSGNGLHVYWRILDSPTLSSDRERDAFREALRRLVNFIGGSEPGPHADMKAAEPARVLRIPETLNHKRKRTVQLIRCKPDAQSRSYDWWRASLPALPAREVKPVDPFSIEPGRMKGAVLWLERWAQEPILSGSRHDELLRVACWAKRTVGATDDIVLPFLQQKAAVSAGKRPITDYELRGILKWA